MKIQEIINNYIKEDCQILESSKRKTQNIFVLIGEEEKGLYLLNNAKIAIGINQKGKEKLGDWLIHGLLFELDEENKSSKKLYYRKFGEELVLEIDEFSIIDYIDDYDYYYEDYFTSITDLKPIYEKKKWNVIFKGENITVTIENYIDKGKTLNQLIYYSKESENNEKDYNFKEREADQFKKYLDTKEIEYINYYFKNYYYKEENNFL